ncbi:NAD(P)-dependent oxidoreductase [Polynucleobacter paneuropaeus]|nr:NAD(P)-dependent oxidoreductase [Polynucleobacter paneuropaeus]
MKVLILGASGFLGGSCSQLFRAHKYDVLTSDRRGTVDFVGNLSNAEFAMSLPQADIIINCAAVQYVSEDLPLFFRRHYFYHNNVVTAKNLYNRYKNTNSRFIHVGTSMMYQQDGSKSYTTKSVMKGDGVYSSSKLEAQYFINKLPNVATVIPCIIGGEGRGGLFNSFVGMIKKYNSVFFPGKGRHPISMVHVDDVASLIKLLSENSAIGFYNAAAPDPLTILDWIDEISDELGIGAGNVRKISLPLAPIQFLSNIMGYRLLAREQLLMLKMPHVISNETSVRLGWQPAYSNARIVRDISRHIGLRYV